MPARQPPSEEEGPDPEAPKPVRAGQEQSENYFQFFDESRMDHCLLKTSLDRRPVL